MNLNKTETKDKLTHKNEKFKSGTEGKKGN
jgi:hypothetical protein